MTTRHLIAYATILVMLVVFGGWGWRSYRRWAEDEAMRRGRRRRRRDTSDAD